MPWSVLPQSGGKPRSYCICGDSKKIGYFNLDIVRGTERPAAAAMRVYPFPTACKCDLTRVPSMPIIGDMVNLDGHVVLLTGASSGFGAATAKALVGEGAKVVLGARREERLRGLVQELGSDNAVFAAMDVTQVEQVKHLVAVGIETFGRIDALVNNAGVMPLSPLAAGKLDEWNRMIDVNIKGVLNAIHAVLGHMLERGSGKVINVSSVAGHVVFPASAVYSGTKFAVRAISEGLRQETAGKIQVTNLSPGAFSTELTETITDEAVKAAMGEFASIAQPAERVAEAIVYALRQDPGVAVNELIIRPTAQPL